jgi:regulator of RNase E activity RraA
VLVGDMDGVMVIPAHLAEEIADECAAMEIYEEFVLEQVQSGKGIIGLYPQTRDEFRKQYEDWLKRKRK